MPWTAKISGVEGLAPEMLDALAEGEKTGLEAIGIKGAEMAQDFIRTPYGDRPAAVAFGNLAASVISTYVSDPSKRGVVIGVSDQLNATAYVDPVETGTRPHTPPASALIPWVLKKFGDMDEKQATSIAFAISKSIAKKGTQGHFMFSRTLDALEPMAVPVLETHIAQAFLRHGFVPLEAGL